jgi:DNA processing protein
VPAEVLDPADPRPAVQAALRDWLALQRGLGLQPARAALRLRLARDPRAALQGCPGAALSSPAELEAAAATLRRVRAVALPMLSPAYPSRLAELPDPPPLLLVRGDRAVLEAPSVAIVGSRAASAEGLATARDFAAAFAEAGFAVVSGLARGIDAAAHRGALAAGGRTLAFQACGPEQVYPASHRELAAEIAGQGAVATELPPGTSPQRAFFPLRNRLISGIASALLVVEARERSGSLITAGHALKQGLDVFAVPGGVSSPACAGSNRLLRDGAQIALEPDDVLRELGRLGAPRRARRSRAIVAALRHRPATRDELARRLGRAPEDLALDLLEAELAGHVLEDRDGRLRVLR